MLYIYYCNNIVRHVTVDNVLATLQIRNNATTSVIGSANTVHVKSISIELRNE